MKYHNTLTGVDIDVQSTIKGGNWKPVEPKATAKKKSNPKKKDIKADGELDAGNADGELDAGNADGELDAGNADDELDAGNADDELDAGNGEGATE